MVVKLRYWFGAPPTKRKGNEFLEVSISHYEMQKES